MQHSIGSLHHPLCVFLVLFGRCIACTNTFSITPSLFANRVNIENADFTDAVMRKDVQKDLCKIAKGTNPVTGEDTKTSLACF